MNPKAIIAFIISLSIILIGSTSVYILTSQSNLNKNTALNKEISLKTGQSVSITGHGIKITFIEVTDDSRCPIDTNCYWEGTASVVINIIYNDQDLGNQVMNSSNLNKVSFMGYYVKLTVLEPQSVSTEITKQSEYKATMYVSEYGPD